MINWTLKTFKLKDLKDNPKNPRKLTEKQYLQLQESIDKFGLIDKPICTQEGLMIGGHQRKKVLKKAGLEEVECYVPDTPLTEKQIEELSIRLNKATGEWDFEMLANEFEILDLNEWGFEAKDFDILEVDEKEPIEKKEKTCANCGYKL